MKNLLLTLILMSFQTTLFAQPQQLYTSKGYPYTNLIKQTDEVKIYFTESQDFVTCKVQVIKGQQQWQSNKVKVKHSAFERTPLASCLQREQAKVFLRQSRQL